MHTVNSTSECTLMYQINVTIYKYSTVRPFKINVKKEQTNKE